MLMTKKISCDRCHAENALHLKTSIRSFRADKQCQFVDADLRRNEDNSDWLYYSFRGTKWQRRNKAEQQCYLVNSYRVLLTRARQGMIIFVPYGVDEEEDATRNYKYYDKIYEYRISCGIKEL